MKKALASYNQEFTRPLIEKIFGSGREDLMTQEGLEAITHGPDVRQVKENLKLMAENTGMPLSDIPQFFKDYSDVFLSVAYYRYTFEDVSANIDRLLFWLHEVRIHREFASSGKAQQQCKKTEDTLRILTSSIRERLARFQTTFEVFWADINRHTFKHMQAEIEQSHTSMGPVLCGMVMKVNSWKKEFPDNASKGPATRLKFIITELEPGLDKLKELENDARRNLGMSLIK
jgi:hypothetical protein